MTSPAGRIIPYFAFALAWVATVVLFDFAIAQPHCEAPLDNLACSEIEYPIFINTTSQVYLDLATQPELALVRFDPPDCQALIRPLICGMFLPQCLEFPFATFPKRICKSYCHTVKMATSHCLYSQSYMQMIECDDQRFFDPDVNNTAIGLCTTMDTFNATIDASALGTCRKLSGETCANLLASDDERFYDKEPVYVPYGASLSIMEEFTNQNLFALNLLQSAETGRTCAEQLYRFTCLASLRPCETVNYTLPLDYTFFGNLTTTVPLSYPNHGPCHSMCLISGLSCLMLGPNSLANSGGISCEQVDPSTGMALFPPDGFKTEVVPGAVMTCDSATEINLKTSVSPLSCVTPLVYDEGSDPVCAQPCIWYIFPEDETEKIRHVVGICAHLSFFLDLMVVAVYVAFPNKRKFPNSVAWQITLISTFIALLIVLSYWIGHRETFCKNDSDRYYLEGFCGFQGIFILWFALVAIFLWLILIIALWRTIVFERDITRTQRRIMYAFSWGWSFILVIYAMSIDGIGYDGFSFLCSFSDRVDATHEFSILFGWIAGCLSIGLPLVIWIFVHISRLARTVNKSTMFVQSYIRLFTLIISLMILFTFAFAIRLDVRLMENEIKNSLRDNIICRGLSSEAECKDPIRPSRFLWVIGSITPAIQGIIVFLTFGLSKDNIALFKKLVRKAISNTHLLSLSSVFSSNSRKTPGSRELDTRSKHYPSVKHPSSSFEVSDN